MRTGNTELIVSFMLLTTQLSSCDVGEAQAVTIEAALPLPIAMTLAQNALKHFGRTGYLRSTCTTLEWIRINIDDFPRDIIQQVGAHLAERD